MQNVKSTNNTDKARRVGNIAANFAKAKKVPPLPMRGKTKQARIIKLLSRPRGTTVGEIMRMTGWQAHSVRGFFAGVVRKKLGLILESNTTTGKRVYRIIPGKALKARKAAR